MNAIQAKFEAPVQVIACSLNTPPYNSNEIEKESYFGRCAKTIFLQNMLANKNHNFISIVFR